MMKLSDKGFTLIEVLVAAAILVFCLCGLLATYVNMFFLQDLARDFTLATNAVQAKMEEVKRTDFTQLTQAKTGPFNLTDYGLPITESKGRLEVEENFGGYTSNLTRVRLIASFKSRGRIIGEDSNLNGILNSGEDTNTNGRLDSPVELVTLIAK